MIEFFVIATCCIFFVGFFSAVCILFIAIYAAVIGGINISITREAKNDCLEVSE